MNAAIFPIISCLTVKKGAVCAQMVSMCGQTAGSDSPNLSGLTKGKPCFLRGCRQCISAGSMNAVVSAIPVVIEEKRCCICTRTVSAYLQVA